MVNNEYFKYGEKLEFVHDRENFDDSSKPLLDFILKYAEIMKYSNSSDRYGYYYSSSINKAEITLGEGIIDEMYDLLKDKKVNFTYDYTNGKLEFIEQNPEIEFELSKINEDELLLKPNVDVFKIALFNGHKYDYLLVENRLYRCNKEFSESTLKVIKAFRENYTSEMLLRKKDLKDFYSVIMPKIENNVKVEGLKEEEIEEFRPEKLAVKVFLDYDDNNYLVADVKFCYGDEEFNPLDEKSKIKALRNELQENRNNRKSGRFFSKFNSITYNAFNIHRKYNNNGNNRTNIIIFNRVYCKYYKNIDNSNSINNYSANNYFENNR